MLIPRAIISKSQPFTSFILTSPGIPSSLWCNGNQLGLAGLRFITTTSNTYVSKTVPVEESKVLGKSSDLYHNSQTLNFGSGLTRSASTSAADSQVTNPQSRAATAVTPSPSTTAEGGSGGYQGKKNKSPATSNADQPKKDGPDASEGHDNTHFSLSSSKHPLDHVAYDQHPGAQFGMKKVISPYWDNPTPHPIYKEEDLVKVKKTHYEPTKFSDKVAHFAVKCMRTSFDIVSGYRGPGGEMTKRDWLNRCLFLETVAGVPGMVAGMCRHLKSLRSMKRDYGWIHTLLEEAENERMHLLIFMNMKNPNILFRMMVLGGQGVFFNMFFITYLMSPQTCHRFVGYLEEEAVKTYTGLLEDLDHGHLGTWGSEAAPSIAKGYYKLPENAVVRDVIACIRADEANHRDVNHTFAGLDSEDDMNPFISKYKPGSGSTARRT